VVDGIDVRVMVKVVELLAKQLIEVIPLIGEQVGLAEKAIELGIPNVT
jgi:hypothetical protein